MPGQLWNSNRLDRSGSATASRWAPLFCALVARWGLSDLLGTRAPGAVFLLATLFSAVLAGLYPSVLTLLIGGIAAFNLFADSRAGEPALSLAISMGLYIGSAWRSSSTSKRRATRVLLEREIAKHRQDRAE